MIMHKYMNEWMMLNDRSSMMNRVSDIPDMHSWIRNIQIQSTWSNSNNPHLCALWLFSSGPKFANFDNQFDVDRTRDRNLQNALRKQSYIQIRVRSWLILEHEVFRVCCSLKLKKKIASNLQNAFEKAEIQMRYTRKP